MRRKTPYQSYFICQRITLHRMLLELHRKKILGSTGSKPHTIFSICFIAVKIMHLPQERALN